jgi:alkyl hydroperoxide reductase subunit AhpC
MGIEILTGPVGRNVDELIRQIKAMQEVAKIQGKLRPPDGSPAINS